MAKTITRGEGERAYEAEHVVVSHLVWYHKNADPHYGGDDETWYLDNDGVHVWVKNYGSRSFCHWQGWRIGHGGSPLLHLNDGEPFESREAAMEAAVRIAEHVAVQHVERAQEQLTAALTALKEVVLPL